jgi:tetratricopeptide (TPR) repeat protein
LSRSAARADAASREGVTIDPSFGPLYRELARCLLARGSDREALANAERALALDPTDLDTALVRAEALDRVGRTEDARRSLRALTLRRPASPNPWRSLLAIAQRTNDAGLAAEATQRLVVLAPEAGSRPSVGAVHASIDAALLADDLAEARRRALRGRLRGGEVAVRAAALGKAALAREEAELVAGADPADASARIALVAAADLRGDMAGVADALRALPRSITPPSSLARWLLAEVLCRRVGNDAARAWLGRADASGDGAGDDADPLLVATQARVRAALATGR